MNARDQFRVMMAEVEKAAPSDPTPLLAAADLADETDGVNLPRLAYALRWCAGHHKRPQRRTDVVKWPWRWIRRQKTYPSLAKKAVAGLGYAILPRSLFDAPDHPHWCVECKTGLGAYTWLGESLFILRRVVEVPQIVLPPAAVVVHSGPVVCAACGIYRDRAVEKCFACGGRELKA